LGDGVLHNGVATLTAKSLRAGKHWIWALYRPSESAVLVVSPIRVRIVTPAAS
jgi:hypothetical protein